jgi:ubiquinone/menaquinone biosynthesis C-methylase UbiE
MPIGDHFDVRAESYDAVTPWVNDPLALGPIVQTVVQLEPRRVLEIGVGSGAVPKFLYRSHAFPSVYVGLDISAHMMMGPKNWLAVQADAAQMPLSNGAFDLAIARQSFHYFAEPSAVVAEAIRVLRVGGALLIAQITSFDDIADIEWWGRAVTLRQPLRCHAFTIREIQQTLQYEGLSLAAVRHVESRSSLVNWLNRYPITDDASFALSEHFKSAPMSVRHNRALEFLDDGDVRFTILWSFVLAFVTS